MLVEYQGVMPRNESGVPLLLLFSFVSVPLTYCYVVMRL